MDYMRIHQGQHGGAAVSLAAAAPVGDQGLLDTSLRPYAHLNGLDASMAAASGMSDQAGGRRRTKSRKGKFMKFFRNSYRSTKKSLKKMLKKSMKALSSRKKASRSRRKGGKLMKLFRNSYSSTVKALSFKKKNKPLSKLFRNSYKSTVNALSFKKKNKPLSKLFRNSYSSTKKSLKKMMRMRGGAGYQYANQADYASPGMLLPPNMESKALMHMNPEWSLDQKTFTPNM